MFRKYRKHWLRAAAAVVAFGICGATAHAGWFSHGSSGGSSGGWSYASSGGSSGGWGSSGGSSGGWRPFRWLFHHKHHHHSSGGSSGGWGSSGGSSGGSYRRAYASHGSSGGWGSSGGYSYASSGGSSGGTTVYRMGDETTTEKPAAEPQPPMGEGQPAQPGPAALPGETESTMYDPNGDSSMLTVAVPTEARIFVNDKPTKTPGEVRQFVSRNLTPGYRYTYRVRAEWEQDGQLVSRVKTVDLRAGNAARLDFTAEENADSTENVTAEQQIDEPANAPATRVTIHLPTDAKLYLSDRESRQSGETRTFTTTALAKGDVWENYTVRAVAVRNGRTVSQERTITLRPGDDQDVRFDFDAPTLAAATGESTR